MFNTADLRQIIPLCENMLRHVVEGDGRYPRTMTPSVKGDYALTLKNSLLGYSSAEIIEYISDISEI